MTILLSAPVQGWVASLDEVDDPVFAQRMAGDGVAIDPTGSTVFAPCDGEVISIAEARHAVTLRGPAGVEILIHLGLETVLLGGDGFTVHASAGQTVQAGDRLLSFDMDQVGRRAKSLLTPVLITNLEAFDIRWREEGREILVGDPMLQASAKLRVTSSRTAGAALDQRLILGLKQGLHARPAAQIGALMQPFAAEIHLEVRGRRANAKNLISLMTLQAGAGDEIRITAQGRDRDAALRALVSYLETAGPPPGATDPGPELSPPLASAPGSRRLQGVRAAAGHAVGPAFEVRRPSRTNDRVSEGPLIERRRLDEALRTVRSDLAALANEGDVSGEIMAAHLSLLDDPDLQASADRRIAAGESAADAWSDATSDQARRLEALDQPQLQSRAADLLDLKGRIIRHLGADEGAPDLKRVPNGAVLIADDLLPSDLLALKGRIVAVCTERGGAASHAAIIAASLRLPMVVALGDAIRAIADGAPILVDGDHGEVVLEPTAEERRASAAALGDPASPIEASTAPPCRTADGVRIEVFANLAGSEGAAEALSFGAEGCGLLRTEFLFMDRPDPPGEDEQRAVYQAGLDGLGGRPMTIRTFDFGGDKPSSFLPVVREDNPALGLRGIRAALRHPELLRPQLRAILKVASTGACRILAPMVTSVDEVIAVKAMLDEERRRLGLSEAPDLGVMIETPAAALMVDQLAAHAAFFSIGSNDLTQYVLAMDRTHAELAPSVDPLHPAVLRLMAIACDAASASGRPVGVCGGVASDPLAAALLIGFGVRELSADPAAIPALKAAIGAVTLDRCRTIAKDALGLLSPGEVRAHLTAASAAAGREALS